MTRRAARVGATLVAIVIVVAGCLTKGPEPVPANYSNIRIYPTSFDRPPYGLEPAPAGRIYQFWLIDTVTGTGGRVQIDQAIPLQRFQWNSEFYFATGSQNDTLTLTTDQGLELGINVLDHHALAVSVEPLIGDDSSAINGPIILGGWIDDFVKMNLTMDLEPPIGSTAAGSCTFTMMKASALKNASGACWRDSTEGMGIWFALPEARDRERLETVALCREDTCSWGADTSQAKRDCRETVCDSITSGTRFGMKYVAGVKNIRGSDYNLWIFPSHPESSFSTFGAVFQNQEPNLIFRDGVAVHDTVSIPPKTGPQMRLGENPIVREGRTVGYVYFGMDTLGRITDTCYLRIDVPESTHCTRDTFAFAPFNDTNVIVRSYTDTWADTSYTSSLPSLPELDPAFGFTYEAWVIFDSSAGTIKPFSLGRFTDKNRLDSNNSHFDVQDLPRDAAGNVLFHFPGEDFLKSIDRPGLPASNLNLFSLLPDVRLKIWITLEPAANDWNSAEPYRQLIAFSGEISPDYALDYYLYVCDQREPGSAPPAYSLPMTYREVSASSVSNNEGHNWPKMTVVLRHPK